MTLPKLLALLRTRWRPRLGGPVRAMTNATPAQPLLCFASLPTDSSRMANQ